MIDMIAEWLVTAGLPANWAQPNARILLALVVLVVAFIADWIARRLILTWLKKIIQATRTRWDDVLLEHHVFDRLSHFASAIVIYLAAPVVLEGYDTATLFVRNTCVIYMLVVAMMAFDGYMNAVLEIYNTSKMAHQVPIRAFVQVIKIIVYFVGIVGIISIIVGRSPMLLLSGLGAMTAVLMLIFKDSILGFVAGVQLSGNKMVSEGDWIAMPKYGADGTVIEVALTTVKVQNWDKTITTIPTYALISDAFKNWRGMEESGGRRIKRSLSIDMSSIRFCDDAMLDRFRRIEYISEYIDAKLREVEEYNASHEFDSQDLVNGRRLTNVGTFRAYIEAYLRNHEQIHQGMTFLVRQLAPGPEGLPIELYVFSNEQRWALYEAIQADIFDHILAVVPEFDLRVFQSPTGGDLRVLGEAGPVGSQ